MINIAFYTPEEDDERRKRAQEWALRLREFLQDIRVLSLFEAQHEGADIALVWKPPTGALAKIPNLKAIISMGQGVDHLLANSQLPSSLPIVRLVDPDMSHAMSHWVLLVILDFLRDGPSYRRFAENRLFKILPQRQTQDIRIGVYGVGAIGRVVAQRLKMMGFNVFGWSKTKKMGNHFISLYGEEGLKTVLTSMDIHICLLPLTSETRHLFCAQTFSQMKKGAYFVNGGRGDHVVESDLCHAIDAGILAGAALDVFSEEPLPPTHQFWSYPSISIWPHVAAQTNPQTAAQQVAQAIECVMKNQTPINTVDISRQY